MTFVVSEIGSNFSNLKDCLDSIRMSSIVGASAAKFQMFSHKEMFGYGSDENLSIKPEWLPELKAEADRCSIELMCTAFSPEGVRLIDPFVSRHKVASSDISYVPLLEAVKATNKPILLSTGACSETDIRLALTVLGEADLTLLYCVANYPATNINLAGVLQLRKFQKKVGYSCHSTEWITPVIARCVGAEVIEKHFKLREMKTPDAPHSLLPEDFKKMVKLIRSDFPYPVMPDPQEREMILRHKRRLCATKAIEVGEELKFGENYGIFRSKEDDERGLSGFAYEAVNGKVAAKPLKAGLPIGPGDFK